VVDSAEFAAAGGTKEEFNRYDRNGDGVLDADEMALRSAAKQKAASDVREMDTNHDGVLDRQEFIAGGGTRNEFDRYDANGDGVLDGDELEQRAADKIEAYAVQRAQAQGRAAVKQMDSNKDGVVDSAEFAAAGGTKEEFNRYDRNGDGVLDADEMALRSAAKQKAASDVREMDTNHDGVLDRQEFIAGGGTRNEFDRYDANGDGVLDGAELEQRAADKIGSAAHRRTMYFKNKEIAEASGNAPVTNVRDFLNRFCGQIAPHTAVSLALRPNFPRSTLTSRLRAEAVKAAHTKMNSHTSFNQ